MSEELFMPEMKSSEEKDAPLTALSPLAARPKTQTKQKSSAAVQTIYLAQISGSIT